MVVKTQDKHPGQRGTMGLHVGADNVQKYFPHRVATIELELDHLQIACSLDPSFWQDNPEIYDSRLSSWLESKRNSGKLAEQDAPIAMIPCGEYAFKVQIGVQRGIEPGNEAAPGELADYALTGPPTPAYFVPVVAPSTLLERRRRNLGNEMGRKPDRRRVAKLRSDDRTSTATSH